MTDNSQSRVARRKAEQTKTKNKASVWKRIAQVTAALIGVAVLAVMIVFSYFIFTAPKLDHSKLGDPASTKVYDGHGELFADLGQERRTKISYQDLPDILVDAVLAT